MYLIIDIVVGRHRTITTLPVTCKEEAAKLVKTIRKYHNDESLSIKLKEEDKIIELEALKK